MCLRASTTGKTVFPCINALFSRISSSYSHELSNFFNRINIKVNTISSFRAHEMGLLLEENGIKFPQMESYQCSKLANVLHGKELARQLNGERFQLSPSSTNFSFFIMYTPDK